MNTQSSAILAGKHRHSSSPASEVADQRQGRCGRKRPHPTTAPRQRNPSAACAVPGWPLRRVRTSALLPLSLKSATILGRGRVRGHEYAIQRDTCRQAQVFVLTCQRSGRSAARTVRSKADQHPATAPGRRNQTVAYAMPDWLLWLLSLSLKSATILGRGQGEGSENTIWPMLLQASTGIRPRLPVNWLICAKDGAVQSDHTLQLRRGEGIKLWLTLCRTDCCGYFPSP